MRTPLLRIEVDEPGERLELVRETAPSRPSLSARAGRSLRGAVATVGKVITSAMEKGWLGVPLLLALVLLLAIAGALLLMAIVLVAVLVGLLLMFFGFGTAWLPPRWLIVRPISRAGCASPSTGAPLSVRASRRDGLSMHWPDGRSVSAADVTVLEIWVGLEGNGPSAMFVAVPGAGGPGWMVEGASGLADGVELALRLGHALGLDRQRVEDGGAWRVVRMDREGTERSMAHPYRRDPSADGAMPSFDEPACFAPPGAIVAVPFDRAELAGSPLARFDPPRSAVLRHHVGGAARLWHGRAGGLLRATLAAMAAGGAVIAAFVVGRHLVPEMATSWTPVFAFAAVTCAVDVIAWGRIAWREGQVAAPTLEIHGEGRSLTTGDGEYGFDALEHLVLFERSEGRAIRPELWARTKTKDVLLWAGPGGEPTPGQTAACLGLGSALAQWIGVPWTHLPATGPDHRE